MNFYQKIYTHKVVFSSLFFLLFLFNVETLLFSHFSNDFSQLFFLFENHVYDFIVKLDYLGLIGVSSIYLLALILKPFTLTCQKCACIGILCLSFYAWNFPIKNSSIALYVFYFALLGTLLWRFLGASMKQSFLPSMNICVVWVFASSLQSFRFLSVSDCVDFSLFTLALFLLILVLIYHKRLFGLYEYANTLILIVGLCVVVLCSSMFIQTKEYYGMRLGFYFLGLLGWLLEYIHNTLRRLEHKI
ncbi:hypothetical protein EPC69_07155 [Helicobacter pylori]|uniref:hypothetical protein n=1 Tax=Helicobacter pylori TaxID=210 RepID=UPI0012382EBC|nr:hypothetical protein [Helicobacter pylori]KAA6507853.1 hypothetical protein EPC70_06930 [Helicobacter pylori]KAA6510951.1 hypothetical protein EPC81_00750 [Helicobacter pylori]KAA6515402.1 hypothetical protein EPC69_07155 [Helicobacter pylori]